MKKLILFKLIFLLFIKTSTAKNVEECFNVIHTISRPQRQILYEMPAKETLEASFSRNILICFLKDYRYIEMEKAATEKYIDIYEMCAKFQRKLPKPFGRKQLSEFEQLGLEQNMISYLNDGVMSGNRKHIYESIMYIKDSMADFIEASDEFNDYKKSILKKLNGLNKHHEEPVVVRVAAIGRRSGQKSNMSDKSIWPMTQLLTFLFIILMSFSFLQ